MDLKDEKWNTKLVNHLKDDDFFNVAKYPTAKLVILSAKSAGGTSYDFKGKMTIRDTTKDISFKGDLKPNGSSQVLTANLNIDRTEYGVKYGSGKFFKNLGDKMISDEFNIKPSIVLTPGKTN